MGVGGTEASTFTEIAKEGSKATLTTGGKAILAATSAVTSAAANKLVGNPSGFSWANVAASIGTAAIASELNLDGGPISEGGLLKGEFASDIVGGFARAGISYGIKKGFFNKGSWNFENVATDAFGNAIGNSIVRASQSKPQVGGGDKAGKPSGTTVGGNTSDPLASIGQSISDNVGNSVTSSINETNARILGEVEQQGADNLAARTEAQQAQQNADFDEVIAANQNASAQRASDFVSQSAAYRHHGNILASQSLQARQAAAERIQQSFDAGVARGENSYLAGVNNRPVSGLSSTEIAVSVYAQASYERSVWADGIARGQALHTTINDFSQSASDSYNAFASLFDDRKNGVSPVSTYVDQAGAVSTSLQVGLEALPRTNALLAVEKALHQPVNVLRSNQLKNVGVPLTTIAETYAPISNAKSLQILADLNRNPIYQGAKVSARVLPGVYAASQLGEEAYFAYENNLTASETSLNVGSRALGTAAELGTGAYVIGKSAAVGAGIGALFGGVGAVPGAAIGAVVGAVTYTFSGAGTAVNNFVTNSTREVIGWFQ
ncbi:hypothetical protein KIH87_12705 [Paraneptunicella aestuarii]|uniref:hypothetical protein n=1 Tax=Paraneptunicella aestuarii TaxID=2831148 RepID=UPI001E5FA54C|nr:hypothetical protein [Paraneptunicella aestuarii]UAA37569.1 hypothetical protein KIH87_12705 [Paraneptunicella aestuarii]